jgi:transcriptional regulator with XRE-family HTH domain
MMIGAELKARRESLGLSQAELAEKLDVAPNTVARWERGELRIANPGMLKWALIAIENELANLSPEEQHKRNLATIERHQREAAERWEQMTPEERAAVERWFGRH